MHTLVFWANLLFVLLCGVYPPSLQAAGELILYYVGPVTRTEYSALPSYCQKLATSSIGLLPQLNLTPSELGAIQGISGYHHYCRMTVLRMRYFREMDSYKKGHILDLIINEAEYTIKYSNPDAPLMTSAYIEKARALVDQGQNGKAIIEYGNAARSNPKDAAPYLDLARLYEKLSNKKKALEIVTDGLKHNPSKSLQRRYLELGGKEPFPTPDIEMATPIDKPPKPQSSAEPVATKQITTQDTVPPNNASPQQAPHTLDNSVDTNKSSGNSYCRFCP